MKPFFQVGSAVIATLLAAASVQGQAKPSDSSFVGYFVYPSELKNILKQWISLYPERIMFGSDAFPFNDAVGAEETFWLAAHSRKQRRSNSRAYISTTMPRASTEK
jgi:predicted TIM-barrel fold metal-dependent hydrolase